MKSQKNTYTKNKTQVHTLGGHTSIVHEISGQARDDTAEDIRDNTTKSSRKNTPQYIEARIADYMARYAPSHAKLLDYASRKGFADISHIPYDEYQMICLWYESYITRGKTAFYIRSMLAKKLFPKDMIQKLLESKKEEMADFSIYKKTIENRRDILLSRAKSLRDISGELCRDFPLFRDEIHTLLSTYTDTDSLYSISHKIIQKYDTTDRTQRDKYIQSMMRRGFGYREVVRTLDIDTEEDT
jgi:SOS response regulatory protein OraA/RecX